MGFANPQYLVETDWLASRLGDPQLRVLECTVVLHPDGERGYRAESGRALAMLQRHDEAIAAFRKALELGEKRSPVYFQLGTAYRNTGKLQLAREAMAEAQRLAKEERARH